jgi:hypothetical protein
MLVIPKRKISNLSLLTIEEREELAGLRAQVTRSISTGGSKIFEFEHGDFVGGPHGCGVDQAHLHLVPLSFDLISAARHTEPSLYWHAQNGPPDWTGNCNPYLYVGLPNKHGYIAYPEQPQSQWFRKLIAAESGQRHLWDYKQFPLYTNVVETMEQFSRNS